MDVTADGDTQLDANKTLYRRWFEEVVSEGDLPLADELLADDYAMHFPSTDEPVDRDGHKQLVMMFRAGFPDWVETVEDVIAEGDRGRHSRPGARHS
jgi:ketosteroid isomerase-like protein